MSNSRPINLRTLAQELNRLNSIVDKLDYLKNRHESNKNLPSYNYDLHTLVRKMPIKHFPDKTNDPEFTYWFLKYNARNMLKNYIDGNTFKNDDSNQLKKRELGIINKLENKANELNDTGVISRLHKYSNVGYLDYFKEDNLRGYSKVEIIETLRILDGQHYINNPTPQPYTDIFSAEVIAYFTHIILKDYLNKFQTVINEEQQDIQSKEINPYPWIFTTPQSYQLFTVFAKSTNENLNNGKDTVLSDISYIYRMMVSENLIDENFKPIMFINWLSTSEFEIVLSHKLKTLDNIGNQSTRNHNYSLQKEILGIP